MNYEINTVNKAGQKVVLDHLESIGYKLSTKRSDFNGCFWIYIYEDSKTLGGNSISTARTRANTKLISFEEFFTIFQPVKVIEINGSKIEVSAESVVIDGKKFDVSLIDKLTDARMLLFLD